MILDLPVVAGADPTTTFSSDDIKLNNIKQYGRERRNGRREKGGDETEKTSKKEKTMEGMNHS